MAHTSDTMSLFVAKRAPFKAWHRQSNGSWPVVDRDGYMCDAAEGQAAAEAIAERMNTQAAAILMVQP